MSAPVHLLHTMMEDKARTGPPPSPELRFASEISSAAAEDGGDRYCSDGHTLHEWGGLFWRPLPLEELEKQAWVWLSLKQKDKATPRTAASCAAAAILAAHPLPARGDAGGAEVVLPVKNGAVEIWKVDHSEFEIRRRQANRADGLVYCLACEHDERAVSNRFLQFLSDVLPDEQVREFVQEYVGYTLLPDCRFQRAQFWLGHGANGKSTLAEIISGLHQRPVALQLDRLDGFQLVGLLGASLVFVDETPARIDEQKLKTLVSGGLTQVDRKYRDPLNLRPHAKWIICGNQLPAVSDHSLGFWRRFPVVPFSQTFTDDMQDPLLAKSIISSDLPGVLNWALAGLLRLLARGRFGVPPRAVLDAIAGGKKETNSVLGWWEWNEYYLSDSSLTPKSDVYADYSTWCHVNGMQPLASPRFWRRLSDVVGRSFSDRKAVLNGRRVPVAPIHLSH